MRVACGPNSLRATPRDQILQWWWRVSGDAGTGKAFSVIVMMRSLREYRPAELRLPPEYRRTCEEEEIKLRRDSRLRSNGHWLKDETCG